MITRITERVIDGGLEENFQLDPSTTTNSLFGHIGGKVQGNGTLDSISAGTVSYTGDSYIYLDWNKPTPTVESVSTAGPLPTKGILLYRISSVSDVTDYRSWTSASVLNDGETLDP